MKNNEKLVQKVRKILNTNKECQDMMKILVDMWCPHTRDFSRELVTTYVNKKIYKRSKRKNRKRGVNNGDN